MRIFGTRCAFNKATNGQRTPNNRTLFCLVNITKRSFLTSCVFWFATTSYCYPINTTDTVTDTTCLYYCYPILPNAELWHVFRPPVTLTDTTWLLLLPNTTALRWSFALSTKGIQRNPAGKEAIVSHCQTPQVDVKNNQKKPLWQTITRRWRVFRSPVLKSSSFPISE